ncbi:MAG: hypothetical protein KKD86_01535 [Bacteroidetes bacterium]|nr:hypothetical protein [Bacteroidota bacterium]MBU1677530.1 hypothetical protein [Bacteroidota bacterium]
METIKVKRHISSSTLKIRELEKFLNKTVQIVITPIKEETVNEEALLSEKMLKDDWDNEEEDLAWDYLQKEL